MADFYASKSGESFWPDAKPAPEPVATPEPEPMMPDPMYMQDPMMDPMYMQDPMMMPPDPMFMPEPMYYAPPAPMPEPMYYAPPAPMPAPAPAPEPEPAPEPVVTKPAAPQHPVQNPPTIQPLVIVPYVSQMQPLYQYTPEAMRAIYEKGGPDLNQFKCGTGALPYASGTGAMTTYGAPYGNAYGYNAGNDDFDDYSVQDSAPVVNDPIAVPAKKEKKKGANLSAIFGLIFGLIAVVFMVIGYFGFLPGTILPYLCVYKDATVLNVIMTDLIEAIQNIPPFEIMAILVPAAVALSALFTILTLLTNLFSVAARRYPIIGKIFAWLAFIFALVAVIVLFATAKDDVKIGAYVLAGITLLIAIICTTGRRK